MRMFGSLHMPRSENNCGVLWSLLSEWTFAVCSPSRLSEMDSVCLNQSRHALVLGIKEKREIFFFFLQQRDVIIRACAVNRSDKHPQTDPLHLPLAFLKHQKWNIMRFDMRYGTSVMQVWHWCNSQWNIVLLSGVSFKVNIIYLHKVSMKSK